MITDMLHPELVGKPVSDFLLVICLLALMAERIERVEFVVFESMSHLGPNFWVKRNKPTNY